MESEHRFPALFAFVPRVVRVTAVLQIVHSAHVLEVVAVAAAFRCKYFQMMAVGPPLEDSRGRELDRQTSRKLHLAVGLAVSHLPSEGLGYGESQTLREMEECMSSGKSEGMELDGVIGKAEFGYPQLPSANRFRCDENLVNKVLLSRSKWPSQSMTFIKRSLVFDDGWLVCVLNKQRRRPENLFAWPGSVR